MNLGNNPSIASLFCGGGFVEVGAIKAGFTPIWGIDKDLNACIMHKLNFGKFKSRSIIHNVTEKPLVLDTPTVLHLSPPCQKFSAANHKNKEELEDVIISLSSLAYIKKLMPKIITVENVQQYEKSVSWNSLATGLKNLGYIISTKLVDMSAWGIPQTRKRFIAVASLIDKFEFLPVENRVNIEDVISDVISELEPAELTKTQTYKMSAFDKELLRSGELAVIKRIGIRDYTTVRYGFQPSFTLLASIGTDGKGASRSQFLNIGYKQKIYNANIRILTRLSTIPDSYDFGNLDKNIVIRAIGNAVPPQFYYQLAMQIKNHLQLK